MNIRRVIETGGVPVKIWTDEVDNASIAQLSALASLPFMFHHVAAMPDVHLGKGATVGAVIATEGALIPAAVGVDIGCGMLAARLSLRADRLPASLVGVRAAMEAKVPYGARASGTRAEGAMVSSWERDRDIWTRYEGILAHNPGFRPPGSGRSSGLEMKQVGTLGGGNHFVELCVDDDDQCWILLHSGSRRIGNWLGQYFIGRAKIEMQRWHIHLPDSDLAYFPEECAWFSRYIEAIDWAQDYARLNRERLLSETLAGLREVPGLESVDVESPGDVIDMCHNYVARERHFGRNVWITRKGATRARKGDFGIIPGSMGTGSFIVRGLGNRESFCSCSHGAGRKLSRTAAKARFTLEDLAEQTVGIECRKDEKVIDEIPGAHKEIGSVMENQSDLVEVVHSLRQVVNLKG